MIDAFAKEYLHRDLRDARATMLWKLEGLTEYDVRRPLTPTGTNLLGLIKHLTITEAWYFGEVFGRPFPERLPWRDGAADERSDDAKLAAHFEHTLQVADMWATEDESRIEIVERYARICEHSDATIAALDIEAPGHVAWWPRPDVKLFNILVHVLTETNRHAGHADILREQLDGAVGTHAGGARYGRDASFWQHHRAGIERAAKAADPAGADGPAMVDAMAKVVTAEADACERLRTTTPPVVDAMWATGLMGRFNPIEAGGAEPTFREMIRTWIEMARLDGSFGWIGIANLPSTAAVAAYLPDAGFAEVFTANDNRVTLGGQFFPNGTGTATDGGYQVTGAWSFGSGTGHSEYVAAGFMPMVDGELVWVAEGVPELRVAIVPRDDVRFTDGWYVQGLKGTGSYDYELADVFVPEHRTFPLFTRVPFRGAAPTFAMGIMPIVAAGHASWALGVARSMLDDVRELAVTKTRMGEPSTLANKPSFQRGLAHHESMWRAARLLVVETFSDVESAVGDGEYLSPTMRADLRASAVYATDCSREIAQWAHLAAGTTAIREGSRLERAFRDLYTGTQHAFISERVATEAAQVWLGVLDDPIGL